MNILRTTTMGDDGPNRLKPGEYYITEVDETPQHVVNIERLTGSTHHQHHVHVKVTAGSESDGKHRTYCYPHTTIVHVVKPVNKAVKAIQRMIPDGFTKGQGLRA